MGTKKCKHCNIDKEISEYNKAGGGKWLQPYCKPCDKIRKEKHRQNNIEKYKERAKNRYLETRCLVPDDIKVKNKIISNKALVENARKYVASLPKKSAEEKKKAKAECDRKYREKNEESLRQKKKAYYLKNGLEQAKKWQLKMKTDINHVTKKKLRGRVYVALKRGIKSQCTMDLLGCSIEEFKMYFASKFTDGMNWDEYMLGKIHIDHIKPCKLFDLTKDEEQKECFNYKNLQPLWAVDNLKKGVSYG